MTRRPCNLLLLVVLSFWDSESWRWLLTIIGVFGAFLNLAGLAALIPGKDSKSKDDKSKDNQQNNKDNSANRSLMIDAAKKPR